MNKLDYRICVLTWLAASISTSCFFEASSELEGRSAGAGAGAEEATEDQQFTLSLDTPDVDLDLDGDGEPDDVTTDPCVLTNMDAMRILTTTCTPCHSTLNQGNFNNVLDFNALPTLVSTVTNPETGQPFRFVVPGDAESSRLYLRIAIGEMPPQSPDPTVGRLPAPTLSDRSVLRTWINSCILGAPGRAAAVVSPSTAASDTQANAGAAGDMTVLGATDATPGDVAADIAPAP